MNILDATVGQGQLQIAGDGQAIALSARLRGVVSDGQRVKAGIRPEALRLAAGDEPAPQFKARVEVVELTGPELVTTARIGEQRITACLPPRSSVLSGEERAFTVEADALHLFDPDSGRSLAKG